LSPWGRIRSIWEASHTDSSSATPAEIWALWSDPARWPEWNEQLESTDLEGEIAVGEKLKVKLRRGGRMQFEIVALEPERLLIDEARLPGARLGHEHRVEPKGKGSEITHRIYVRGPFSGLFALLLGRKRMSESVVRFVEREKELAE
jgi:Polyketide cyclase / dehydrase and lipid transport